jgi:taurine--2-oxoglutarate transaminase
MDRTSAQVIKDSREYTLFSWSVQSATSPIHMTKAEGVWFWDGDGNKWLDFNSQLVNLNIGHQHPQGIGRY